MAAILFPSPSAGWGMKQKSNSVTAKQRLGLAPPPNPLLLGGCTAHTNTKQFLGCPVVPISPGRAWDVSPRLLALIGVDSPPQPAIPAVYVASCFGWNTCQAERTHSPLIIQSS